MKLLRIVTLLALAAATACAAPPPPAPPMPAEDTTPAYVPAGRAEILWDTYGVPHVYAEDADGLLYGVGWAQLRSHPELVLHLYARARAEAASHWGADYLESDRWLALNGVPERAEQWLELISAQERALLEAYTDGMNAFAAAYPDSIPAAVRAVLPVRPADVLAHAQQVIHFTFMASPQRVQGTARAWERGGSNGWAIGPARSASGNALLLANPHLPWGDLFTWYEMHLESPEVRAYGAGLVGFPLPQIAFNEVLGWTHTVNTYDGMDLYELSLVGGTGYLWDGGWESFDTETRVLQVRQPDGSMTPDTLVIQRSVHGPVVAMAEGRALALRVAGLDAPGLVGQYWSMLQARGLQDFDQAMARLQLPMFSTIYADRAGHIQHVFNGRVPVREQGGWAFWSGIVPGDTSATLWTRVHDYHVLPAVLDPQTGWLQNTNDPPWTSTLPSPLRPETYRPYMAPVRPPSFRTQHSLRMLTRDATITFEELVAYKHATRAEAADHFLEDLMVAARLDGRPAAARAAEVLAGWDRRTDADSRGAVLFEAFMAAAARHRWLGGSMYQADWDAAAPLATPDGLSDPATAVDLLVAATAAVDSAWGAADVAWGEVHRLRRDGVDLPANGGPDGLGTFRVTDFQEAPDGRQVATGGDSFVMVVEFGARIRARALLGYGNASRAGSPHRTDQLELYARQELRPVWWERAEVEANLRFREAL